MKDMKTLISILFIIIAAAAAFAQADRTYFQTVEGRWKGTLEYKDYQSNGRVTMAVIITIKASPDGKSADVFTIYDDFGKVYRSPGKERIEASTYFDGETPFKIESSEAGKIVMTGETQDGNDKQPTRKTITYTADTLTILKETRTPWTFRHVYTLRRAAPFKPADKILASADMKSDFAALKQTLVAIHPGIYRYMTPADVEREYANFASRLNSDLPEREFFIVVAQFVSLIKCGHTYANPYNMNKEVRERLSGGETYLPFYFTIDGGRMIVAENASSKKLAAGTEITKINGVAVSEIFAKLLTVTHADGRNTNEHRWSQLELPRGEAELYALFDIYFPLFFPMKDEIFAFEAVDGATKKPIKFEVAAMSKTQRTEEMAKRYGPTADYDDGWKFEIRDEKLAVLTISNSITWRLKRIKFEEFLAAAFAEIRTKNVANLVIDVRGNGGGSMDLGYELSRYLATRELPPYALGKRLVRNVAAQPEIAKFVDTYSDELMSGLKNGVPTANFRKIDDRYFEILGRDNYPAVKPYENSFRGRAFVIADSSIASATYQFLDYVKNNKLATIVGQPGGGNLQGINGGNYFFLRLPASKFEIDIPVYFQKTAENRPDSPVIPDIVVKRGAEFEEITMRLEGDRKRW